MQSTFRVFFVISLLLVQNYAHSAFTQMISFGDSLSDTGNIFAATGTPPAPYFNGRFSDGQVWNELLAADLGIAAPTPSLLGGTNYAHGGARVLVDGATGGFPPSLQTQVDGYLLANGGVADSGALFTLWGGGNDINALSSGATITDLQNAAAGIASMAEQLINAGAQSILIANVPNVGLAPIADGNETNTTNATALYNGTILASLAALGLDTSPNIAILDTFTISNTIAANPAAYGITNVDDRCIDALGAGTVSDCSEYLFFDDLHPTAAAGSVIADAALPLAQSLAPVPVPGALPLLFSAIFGVLFCKRAGRKNI